MTDGHRLIKRGSASGRGQNCTKLDTLLAQPRFPTSFHGSGKKSTLKGDLHSNDWTSEGPRRCSRFVSGRNWRIITSLLQNPTFSLTFCWISFRPGWISQTPLQKHMATNCSKNWFHSKLHLNSQKIPHEIWLYYRLSISYARLEKLPPTPIQPSSTLAIYSWLVFA